MNILLVGEYSNLHNSLKQGLEALGHRVTLVSSGDSFKNYPTDVSYKPKFSETFPFSFINKVLVKLHLLNLRKIEAAVRFFFFIRKAQRYDVVQLINSDALQTYPFLSRWLYERLFRLSERRFLLICGDETPIIHYYYHNTSNHYFLTPLRKHLEGDKLKKYYTYALKYLKPQYAKTFQWLLERCNGLITSDFDYETPMQALGYATTFIPNPINMDIIPYTPNKVGDKVKIFLGINTLTRDKKGISIFEEALMKIQRNYPDAVELLVTENVPYKEYISIYTTSHILLDQIYANDQGYNALTAMAQGKVVLTGAGEDWREHFNLQQDEVALHAEPDADAIYKKLEHLIQNPHLISQIGENARTFIETHHHYIKVARQYVEAWGG